MLKLQLSAWAHGFSARKATENVEAYDYTLRGLHQWARMIKKDNLHAREFFETALTLDPQYAMAYALVGITYYTEWSMYWNRDPQTLERAVEYGQKAVALHDFYFGHLVMALASPQLSATSATIPMNAAKNERTHLRPRNRWLCESWRQRRP